MDLIISEAPARICFFGDHQDYLNLPVIAGSIDRKITVKGRPNTTHNYNIQLIDLDRVITIDLNEKFTTIEAADYYRSSMVILQREGAVFEQGYSIEITGNIPVNAGVSSSSALVVAWLRFLIQAQKNPKPVSNVQIGNNVIINSYVKIGNGCHIGSNVILSNTFVGDNVVIKSGTVIGQIGFGFKYEKKNIVLQICKFA